MGKDVRWLIGILGAASLVVVTSAARATVPPPNPCTGFELDLAPAPVEPNHAAIRLSTKTGAPLPIVTSIHLLGAGGRVIDLTSTNPAPDAFLRAAETID